MATFPGMYKTDYLVQSSVNLCSQNRRKNMVSMADLRDHRIPRSIGRSLPARPEQCKHVAGAAHTAWQQAR